MIASSNQPQFNLTAARPGEPDRGASALLLRTEVIRNQAAMKSVDTLRNMFLASEDTARFRGSLSKLARHLAEPLTLTGSIAAHWHLLRNDLRRKVSRLNDIDVVVEGLLSLRASLTRDFLIRHFHGFAIIRLDKYFTVDEVVFAEKGDLLLLGARTLEGLSLKVDPRKKKLVASGPILAA
jgi:hypothetical protein